MKGRGGYIFICNLYKVKGTFYLQMIFNFFFVTPFRSLLEVTKYANNIISKIHIKFVLAKFH